MISTILAIYLLALAALPCADETAWCVFDIEAVVGVELHEGGTHHHETDCGDHCSPFCICSCCQMNVRTPDKAALLISSPEPFLLETPLFKSMFQDLTPLKDIWQPPKLA